VSRAPDHCGHEPREPSAAGQAEIPAQSPWQWVAVGLLVLCWIAEAVMCADRGF
jgi:hypothetical protein